jgi:sodium/pantothenate symporter
MGDPNTPALYAFVIYTAAVLLLAVFSHKLLQGKSFLKEYFLGSRGLGLWALAMSYAATSSSGGSFMGFPALIYQHGWILGLWIASYMVVPVCCMGMLGKRINQIARKTGAITVPDIFRDRFRSPGLGVISSLLLAFFLVFNLSAQFKAGAIIMETLLGGHELFQAGAAYVSWIPENLDFGSSSQQAPGYYLALLIFAVAVVAYTAYGGFRAVVWTDVLQGIVMFIGVILLLFFTLDRLGDDGIAGVTEKLKQMRLAPAQVETQAKMRLPMRTRVTARSGGLEWNFVTQGGNPLTPEETATITVRFVDGDPLPKSLPADTMFEVEPAAPLDGDSPIPVASGIEGVTISSIDLSRKHNLLSGPGYHAKETDGFLPFALGISFFVMWAISGAGQPTTWIRLMAFKDTTVFRRAIFAVSIYYTLIYIPLVIVFVCGRTILPDLDAADKAMPALVLEIIPGFLGGIILAAPFAAVMSTVDSFLLAISSSIVRDIYQRTINPDASPETLRKFSYATTIVLGIVALVGAMNPPEFLQHIIVLVGAGLSCTFLAPMFFTLYWKRANTAGVYAGMLGGFGVCSGLYVVGWLGLYGPVGIQPHLLGGFLPVVWGMIGSIVLTVVVTLMTPPPPPELVDFYFKADPAASDDV